MPSGVTFSAHASGISRPSSYTDTTGRSGPKSYLTSPRRRLPPTRDTGTHSEKEKDQRDLEQLRSEPTSTRQLWDHRSSRHSCQMYRRLVMRHHVYRGLLRGRSHVRWLVVMGRLHMWRLVMRGFVPWSTVRLVRLAGVRMRARPSTRGRSWLRLADASRLRRRFVRVVLHLMMTRLHVVMVLDHLVMSSLLVMTVPVLTGVRRDCTDDNEPEGRCQNEEQSLDHRSFSLLRQAGLLPPAHPWHRRDGAERPLRCRP